MSLEKEFGLRNFTLGQANKRAIVVRKMAAQVAKKSGFTKTQSHFLAKVACLLNSREERVSLEERGEEILNWLSEHGTTLCNRLTWTQTNLEQARIILTSACGLMNSESAADSSSKKALNPELVSEATELGRVLAYVERVTEYSSSLRQMSASQNKNGGAVAERSTVLLEFLRSDTALFNSLPRTMQNHLDRKAKLAA